MGAAAPRRGAECTKRRVLLSIEIARIQDVFTPGHGSFSRKTTCPLRKMTETPQGGQPLETGRPDRGKQVAVVQNVDNIHWA